MRYVYKLEWQEENVKCPIVQMSTFVFENARDGKRFFEMMRGMRQSGTHGAGHIYSRISNPDLEILKDRLRKRRNTKAYAVFENEMEAIITKISCIKERMIRRQHGQAHTC
jgi:methionine-gamma-lyase